MTDTTARDALQRVNRYLAMRIEKPTHIQDDRIHGVHFGTEWEGELRLSDVRALVVALFDDGWRDIAEAPRDGACVQVWTGHYQHTAWYNDNLPGWCAMADDVELVFQPTHFRDLPAPPREK